MPENIKTDDVELLESLASSYMKIKDEIAKTIVGQDDVVEKLIITLLCRGHCLLVGVPGLAKTLMISTLARAIDLSFSRIQFTPDLMPSDIVGTEVIEEDTQTGRRNFRFVKGPVFANIILADEINRTPPKTQSALLEAMQEHAVTVQGKTMHLEEPFFVLATQNPIEHEGTYPLPEAQLDRFMFNLWIDYPSQEEEVKIVMRTTGEELSITDKVLNSGEIIALQNLVRRVPASDEVVSYAVELARKTRPEEEMAPGYIREWVKWGAGPRASQYLILGAKAKAAIDGRFVPSRDDVRSVAMLVLRHRLVTTFAAEAEGVSAPDIINRLTGDLR
ncbi:MAG: MoxR family ATPase [Candidatus Latescibacteria bacterium]|jgi:MoxR-like ATPase|nr:MoxR family ATPase [Candidatus Latescibacterota bacterium]